MKGNKVNLWGKKPHPNLPTANIKIVGEKLNSLPDHQEKGDRCTLTISASHHVAQQASTDRQGRGTKLQSLKTMSMTLSASDRTPVPKSPRTPQNTASNSKRIYQADLQTSIMSFHVNYCKFKIKIISVMPHVKLF